MISFIVPAYNEEQCLAETLDALHTTGLALGEEYEVMVADDGSTDQTAAIAVQRGAALVSVTHRQIAATRNSGARAATGDLLIFVDADTVVDVEVARAAVDAMRRGAVGGGAGIRFDEPVPWFARVLLWVIMRIFRATGLAAGCFLFCTRAAFDAVGGFDEKHYGAEEIVMSRALKKLGR
jgi:glycosyltransferase involved in cell wall biosynthesis